MHIAHANKPCRNQCGGVARGVVKAFAVEPDPRALAALDAEIIARQRVALVVAPPFHGDALGPFGMRDLMRHAPPGNCTGGPSGTSAMASIGSGRSNRRIGRAGTRLSCSRRSCDCSAAAACRMRRHGRHRDIPEYACPAARAASRGAGRSARPAGRSDAQAPRAWSGPASPVCAGSQRSVASADEPHHVEAEARIAFVAERGEPLLEQPADARGIAQRRAGADLEAVHLAVGAEQRDLQQARALAAPLQHARQVRGPDARWCRARRPRARSARRSAARPYRPAPAGAA